MPDARATLRRDRSAAADRIDHATQVERLLSQLPVALYIREPGANAIFRYVSPRFERLTGLGVADLPPEFAGWLERIHPDDRAAVQAADDQAGCTGDPAHIEYRIRGGSGEWVWIDNSSVLTRDEHGRPLVWHGTLLVISERKRLEAELRDKQAQLQTIVDSLPAALYRQNPPPDVSSSFVNPGFASLIGVDPDSLPLGFAAFFERVHPDDRQPALERAAITERTGEPFDLEYRLRRGDGDWIWIHDRSVIERDPDGGPGAWTGVLLDITKRKQLEAALRDSEVRFRRAFEETAIGMSLGTADNRCLDANAAYCRIVGVSRQELIGRHFAALTHPDDRAREAALHEQLRAGEIDSYQIEKRYPRPDGTVVTGALTVAAVRDDTGTLLYDIAHMQDITAQKVAEAALRESEAHLRTIVNRVPAAVYRLEPGDNGRFTFASPRFQTMTGLSIELGVNRVTDYFARVHPDDLPKLLAADAIAGQTGEPLDLQYRLRGESGEWIWVHDRSDATRDEQGRPITWHGVLLDISEQKRLETELRESEDRFRRAFESAGIGMSLIAPGGRIVDVNSALCRMLGFTREELLRKTFREITHPDDDVLSHTSVQGLYRGEQDAYTIEKRYVRKDGQVVWANLTANTLRDADGALIYIMAQIQDITARKEAESALRESETRFRSIFEGAGIGMSVTTPAMGIVLANPALAAFLGYSVAELVGMSVDDLTHPDDIPAQDVLRRQLHAGQRDGYELEKRYVRKDGEIVWGLLHVTAIRDDEGVISAVVGQVQDITARKRAEAALRDSEARFRALVHNDPDVIAVVDAAGSVVYMSPSSITAFGTPAEEMLGPVEPRHELIHPEDREQALGLFDRVSGQPGDTASTETRIWHEQRGWRWFQVTVANQLADPSIAGYIYNVRDITERKEAEAALHASETRFRSIFEGAGIGMALSVPEGRILVANPALEQLLGYAPGELEGVRIEDITYPDDLVKQTDLLRQMRAGEIDAYQFEKRFVRKDGGLVWGMLDATAVKDEQGVIQAIIGQVQDITARKEAEAALRESESRLRALIQNDPDVFVIVDDAMAVTYVSPSAADAFGVATELMLGSGASIGDYLHPDDADRMQGAIDEIGGRPGATAAVEARIRHPTVGWRWFQIAVANLRDDPGIRGYLFNLRDITDRKRAELATANALKTQQAAIRELEQLNQSKSQFLATISHEFRTPLTAIIGYSELLAGKSADPASFADDVAVIHREASRLSRMVDDILVVDRADAGRLRLQTGPVDLNALVRDVVGAVRPLADRHRLTLDLDLALRPITGDPDRLSQALTNLLGNAVKYSPDGGEIAIATRSDGDDVHVTVRDEGIGIAADDLSRIFGRFERVESGPSGRIAGAGLGLAIALEIAELHGGRLWAESELGLGSTFHLTLPAAEESSSRAVEKRRQAEGGRKTARQHGGDRKSDAPSSPRPTTQTHSR
jgi:PAS domain S-box-containing protein